MSEDQRTALAEGRMGEEPGWRPFDINAPRVVMVATFDVTHLSERERDALAFEVAVQAETSDYVGEDENGWQGHEGVDAPTIEYRTVTP